MSVGAVNKQTGDRIPTAGMTVVDSVLSGSSTNPVQNKVVKEALDGKADTDIVAADFNVGTSYTAGNYCIYEGKFYKFKASHSGAWSAADVDEIKIAGELAMLKSGLTGLITVGYLSATLAVGDNILRDANGAAGAAVTSGDVPTGNNVYMLVDNAGSSNSATFSIHEDGSGTIKVIHCNTDTAQNVGIKWIQFNV